MPPPIIAEACTTPSPRVVEGCCFIAGTKVVMADGSQKNIEDIVVGDKVLGHENAVNIVTNITPAHLGDRKLIAINNSNYFSTEDHVFKGKDGWVSASPERTEQIYPDVVKQIEGIPNQMSAGTILLTIKGEAVVEELKMKNEAPETLVYDISVTGDHTYFANDFLVHNKHGGAVCFFSGTKVLMADGTLKKIENINVGDVTMTGEVHQKFARDYDYAFETSRNNGCRLYDGIFVTGFHVVKKDGHWMASHDLEDAILSPPEQPRTGL